MPNRDDFKVGLLWWLPIIFGVVLAALVVLSSILLVIGITNDDAPNPILFTGLLLTLIAVFLFADYTIFHMNKRQNPERKLYYPSLRLLGIGLLAGSGSSILYLFGKFSLAYMAGSAAGTSQTPASGYPQPVIIYTIFNAAPDDRFILREEFVVFIVLALLLALIIWAIVKISQSE